MNSNMDMCICPLGRYKDNGTALEANEWLGLLQATRNERDEPTWQHAAVYEALEPS